MRVLMLCMRHVNTKYTVNITAFKMYGKILSLKYVYFFPCVKRWPACIGLQDTANVKKQTKQKKKISNMKI